MKLSIIILRLLLNYYKDYESAVLKAVLLGMDNGFGTEICGLCWESAGEVIGSSANSSSTAVPCKNMRQEKTGVLGKWL